MLNFGPYQFTPGIFPSLATVAVLAVLLHLGFWQLDRGALKEEMVDRRTQLIEHESVDVKAVTGDPEDVRYTAVTVRGSYLSNQQFLLDNRTHQGVAGYHVVTPLRTLAGDVILVNRGWVPVGVSRAVLPNIDVDPTQERLITGRLTPPGADAFMLGESGYDYSGWPRTVQRLEPARVETILKTTVSPYVVRLDPAAPNGYVREWPAHGGITAQRHRGYAVQWFSLALALMAIYVVVNTTKRENTHQ